MPVRPYDRWMSSSTTSTAYLRYGPRVAVRRICRQDYEEITALRAESADLLHRWLGAREESVEAFEASLARFEQPTHEGFVVCLRDTGAIVGGVNVNNIVRGSLRSGMLGYTAYASSVGRGYLTEGVGLVIRFAFEELELHRLEANIQPDNVASLNLVRRLGFRHEGHAEAFQFIGGAWRDHERWALTAETAEAQPGAAPPRRLAPPPHSSRRTAGVHERYGLTRVINARGTYTPLGVSRSAESVAAATAEALGSFFVMAELQDVAGRTVAAATGAEAATVVHCTSSALTLSVAASMTGDSAERIAALPDATGLPSRVVLPAGHAVDYGHPLLQDIRLAGAVPVPAGTEAGCTVADLDEELSRPGTACLLLVSSRLVRGAEIPLAEAVAAAHRHGVPAVVDGAAQDLRIEELLGTGADLVLVSGQKYLGAPTAGLVIGRAGMVRAVRAQEKGIGRAMKASKEAVCGVLAAVRARQETDLGEWRREQEEKVARFTARAGALPGVDAAPVPDPTGLPFPRARLRFDPAASGLDAVAVADALRAGSPPVWLMDDARDRGELTLELVPLTDEEIDTVVDRLTAVVTAGRTRRAGPTGGA